MDIERLKELAEQARDEGIHPNPSFPPSLYYRFFKLLARDMKPELSVELGVCGGGGSLHLAIGYSEGSVIGVDIQDDYPPNTRYILENHPNFLFLEMDSVKASKTFSNPIDILFIDTDHRYEKTLIEFEAYQPLMRKGGVVIFDDILRHHPDDVFSMEDAWNTIPGDKVRLDFLHEGDYPHGGGLGVTIL
jgi:predicted O-methyltransferase YrrM